MESTDRTSADSVQEMPVLYYKIMGIKIINPESSVQFKRVAELHRDGITEGFLSTLGIPFLTVLYRGIAHAESSGISVALDEHGNVLGFVSYALDVKNCYKKVIRENFISLSFAMLPNVFNISIYRKIIETLAYPFMKKETGKSEVERASALAEDTVEIRPELLSMAVDANTRGGGIGKLLVETADDWMRKAGVTGYYVVTYGLDERSNGFYQRCGFEKIHSFLNHGKPMNEYYKDLTQKTR